MAKERENIIKKYSDINLFFNAIKKSEWFRQQMLKAFNHGLQFTPTKEQNDCAIISANDLPFSEWFSFHFK